MGKRNIKDVMDSIGEPSEHEILIAPNKLQDKVSEKRKVLADPVALAESVMLDSKPKFEIRFEDDMRDLISLFQGMQLTSEFDLDRLVVKVHEVRGEAGTFGYTLVTEIGRMLCEYIPTVDRVGPTEQSAISAHLQAMQTVVTKKIKGEGPEIAKQVIDGLRLVLEKSEG